MIDLKSRLVACARAWAEAHDDAPMSRLGKQVAGDANFFVRIASPDASLNLSTLEKFARFLADGANWPEGAVPAEVMAFARVVGVAGCGEHRTHGAESAVDDDVPGDVLELPRLHGPADSAPAEGASSGKVDAISLPRAGGALHRCASGGRP